MSADDLLGALAAQMGLDGARFDDNRSCRLKFDNRLEVDLESPADSGVLNLFGLIGKLPAQTPAEFCESLLEANLPSDTGAGPVVALDGSSRELLLVMSFVVTQINVDTLAQTLERFLTELEDWQARLAASGQHNVAHEIFETPASAMVAV